LTRRSQRPEGLSFDYGLDRGQGRVLLTVVASHTRRLVSAHPAYRYPCLADESLPPLPQSMRGDLDWLFGEGFAKALAKAMP